MHDFIQPRERFGNYLLVKKQQRCQRLILRCRRHLARCRKIVQKRRYFRGSHLAGMPLAGEQDESFHPLEISLLGPVTIMVTPDRLACQVKQPRGFTPRLAAWYVMVIHMRYPLLNAELRRGLLRCNV